MDASLIAYSAQKNLFDRLDVVANNVANANTHGFKSDLSIMLKAQGEVNNQRNPIPSMIVTTDQSQGGFNKTNRQLDVAIQGNGYIQVETPLGPRFTRSGSLVTDADGALVTAEGYPVVGDGGAINLQPDDGNIAISQDGQIVSVRPDGNQIRGAIGVFKFANPNSLQKTGNNYFIASSDPDVAEYNTDFKIQQGMVENSNVNSVSQMTEMVGINRSVQNLSKIIEEQNQLMRNAVQRITARN